MYNNVIANTLNIPLGEYICKNETQRNWPGTHTSNGACGLIWCNAKTLTKAWHVKKQFEREKCPRERRHKWCMVVVSSCCKVGLSLAMNAYKNPKRIDIHVQLGEIFKLDCTTLKSDDVLTQDER